MHDNTILYRFAWQHDMNGDLFNSKTAAVEIINLLRPIVAISIFINFLMLAIHHYPEEKEKLKSGVNQFLEMFVQEVRRFYPFFHVFLHLLQQISSVLFITL